MVKNKKKECRTLLQQEIINEYGNKTLRELEIPSYITSNLNKELREYQIEALKYFLLQRQKPQTNHLMFNMATGSGKTLMMAALMLHCYKQGYRDFIFFVNSTSILEKTKCNFADRYSSKYLFKENLLIDSKQVEINVITSLNESRENAINLYFTTIQSLFSLLTKERENAIGFNDLVDKKLVFLADEAHHLNADTKKGSEKELKEGWESIIKKAFASHKENLLLEFSATIPNDNEVMEKYKDKIVCEYDLKRFCEDGYSKRIFFVKYDDTSLDCRFLGAILLSLYRELVAYNAGICLKPVILFKSDNIAESINNHTKFIEFVENLSDEALKNFYLTTKANSEMLFKSKEFFKQTFKENMYQKLVELIQNNFKEIYMLNTNSEEQLEKNQILLNSLEDSSNLIRVIFSVDKLNEGWDVLNLFDIVRLGDKKKTSIVTTKEAQLIGRGARYYPFKIQGIDLEYKRKFDSFAENPLSNIERLTYHTLNDVEFIKNLNDSMAKQGLLIETKNQEVKLEVNPKLKEVFENHTILYAKNHRYKKKEILNRKIKQNEIEHKMLQLKVPLFAEGIEEIEERFDGAKEEDVFYDSKYLNSIDTKYFLKAMQIEKLDFKQIKNSFDCASKVEFIEKYLGEIPLLFAKKQEFSPKNCLEIAKFVLKNCKEITQSIENEYEVSKFEAYKLDKKHRSVFMDIDKKVVESNYEWLLYKTLSRDSDLEKDFLDFINANKEKIDNAFCTWFVIRNERFAEFKIYDNREGADTYGVGFEPDFIFFGKRQGSEKYLSVECFMEVKGEHLASGDAWKEEFLKEVLHNKELTTQDKTLRVFGLPFFINTQGVEFNAEFKEFLENKF